MLKLKVVALIAVLIALMTWAAIFLVQQASVISANSLETEHHHIQSLLSTKLGQAESSLFAQARTLASDATLSAELGSVRDKLLSTTPEELRKSSSNTWNINVFNRLIYLLENLSSEIKQHNSSINAVMHAPRGNMLSQKPLENWWGDSPDLLLAFAAVPMKDGSISATLIAQGMKGKELQAGKRYEQEIHVLDEVIQKNQPIHTHFPWNGKMYTAVVAPVFTEGKPIGLIVLGNEISRDLANSLVDDLPRFIQVMVVYADPGFGEKAGKSPKLVVYPDESAGKSEIASGKFYANADEMSSGGEGITLAAIPPAAVYLSKDSEKRDIAVSRLRWFWDEKQETDIYIVSDLHAAQHLLQSFRSNILIAALIILIIGALLGALIIQSVARDKRRIKIAFADAISSGSPLDTQALALLFDENADDIPQYQLKKVESESGSPENWDNLMMEGSTDAANGSDAEPGDDELPEESPKAADTPAPDTPKAPETLKAPANTPKAGDSQTMALYEEYMRLRKENHIDAPMTYESFLQKLESNTAQIKAKYNCESVSFHVHVNNGNVVLKPRIVKKS